MLVCAIHCRCNLFGRIDQREIMAGSTSGGSPQSRPTKNQRREAAREKARQFREQQERQRKRKRLLIQIGVIVAVVAVVLGGWLIIQSVQKHEQAAASVMPANMPNDGVVISEGLAVQKAEPRAADVQPERQTSPDGRLVVEIYADFMCPICGQFEQTYGQMLSEQAQAGNIDLVIHPVSILDQASQGTKYSTRSAAAAASVATYAPDSFLNYFTTLLQPGVQANESTSGLSDDRLVELARQVIGDDHPEQQDQVEKSIRDGEFKKWVKRSTDAANLTGTPTVYIDGQSVDDLSKVSDTLQQKLKDRGIDMTQTGVGASDGQ
ncbi:thioredoxin domain-containing protein [Pseudoclavibacter sp. CFCC 13796]|nr:thioredoxin domain-containing protein [Pseudoclavibacter sp. CFCC 13796]